MDLKPAELEPEEEEMIKGVLEKCLQDTVEVWSADLIERIAQHEGLDHLNAEKVVGGCKYLDVEAGTSVFERLVQKSMIDLNFELASARKARVSKSAD